MAAALGLCTPDKEWEQKSLTESLTWWPRPTRPACPSFPPSSSSQLPPLGLSFPPRLGVCMDFHLRVSSPCYHWVWVAPQLGPGVGCCNGLMHSLGLLPGSVPSSAAHPRSFSGQITAPLYLHFLLCKMGVQLWSQCLPLRVSGGLGKRRPVGGLVQCLVQ